MGSKQCDTAAKVAAVPAFMPYKPYTFVCWVVACTNAFDTLLMLLLSIKALRGRLASLLPQRLITAGWLPVSLAVS